MGARAAGRHRRRPAAVLAGRAGPAGPAPSRTSTTTFVNRGGELFAATVEGGVKCAELPRPRGHRRPGAPYTLTDADGEFVATVNWQAPALDTVLLRFTHDEVEYILNYGRPFSPDAGAGARGGGPLNEQQIDEPRSTTSSRSSSAPTRPGAGRGAEDRGLARRTLDAWTRRRRASTTTIPRSARPCSTSAETASPAAPTPAPAATRGAGRSSEGDDADQPPDDADLSVYVGFPDGSGAFGPNLTGGAHPAAVRRPRGADRRSSATAAPTARRTASNGQRQRPHARLRRQPQRPRPTRSIDDGMLTPEMIAAIARTRRACRRPSDADHRRAATVGRGAEPRRTTRPRRADVDVVHRPRRHRAGTRRSAASSPCSWASWC